jgi:DNA-binding XRE family transcriptional regulator
VYAPPGGRGGSRVAKQKGVPVIELDGRRYVVLREAEYLRLQTAVGRSADDAGAWASWEQDSERLGERLAQRRRDAGLSQAGLARVAGLRVETLNRIERGHNSPDFATVRKLVLALREAGAGDADAERRRRKEAR